MSIDALKNHKAIYDSIMNSSPKELNVYIEALLGSVGKYKSSVVGTSDLYGFIRGLNNSFADLLGVIESNNNVSFLYGSIYGQGAKDLYGLIGFYVYDDLYGYIKAYNQTDLYGEILGFSYKNLRGSISGRVIEAHANLNGFIRSMDRASLDLRGVVTGVGSSYSDLGGTHEPINPVNLYAYIGVHPPEDLYGIIYATKDKRVIDRLLIYFGPTKDLLGTINGTGGFADLLASIKSITSTHSDLYGTINGYGHAFLDGYINPKFWKGLFGVINPKTANTMKGLYGVVNPVFAKDLLASINPNENKKDLFGEISTIGASSALYGYINPGVYYFSDVILLDNIMYKDLRGIIYSGTACDRRSGYSDLVGFIRAMTNNSSDLSGIVQPRPYNAMLYGYINGDYSFPGSSDLLGTISSIGTFNDLVATIYSPISYLKGLIIGSASSSSDLDGYMKIYEWNVFLNATINPRLLIPKSLPEVKSIKYKTSGGTKIIDDMKVKFFNQGYEYIRSDLLSNTFLIDENSKTWGVELSITQTGAPDEGFFADKVSEKVKVFFDLHPFNSFDEAMRYFIDFLAYGIKSDLSGYIVPKGGFSDLEAHIIATDPNKVKLLYGSVYPIILERVLLDGQINGVGEYHNLISTINGVDSFYTNLYGEIQGYGLNDLEASINPI